MSNIELKPCPFCGNAKGLEVTTAMDMEECENFEQCGQCSYFTVVCNINDGGCGAASGFRPSKEQAVELWNRRVKE